MQTPATLRIGDVYPAAPAESGGHTNPRTHFDDAEAAEFEASVKANGILQPILVRPRAAGGYEIIAGERRWRAALKAFGVDGDIPAMSRDCTDAQAAIFALIENTERADMSASEEAEAAHRILLGFGGNKVLAADRLGWDVQKLERRVALMRLTPEARAALTTRKILLGHAELLAAIPSEKQNATLEKIIASGASVATLKDQLGRLAHALADAVFDRVECATCPHNTDQQSSLFAESLAGGFCTNPPCYSAKESGHLAGQRLLLLEEVPRVEILDRTGALSTVKLVVDGAMGVGQAQAAACRGCANFGYTISALPGHVGEVEKSICFDTGCNTTKVALNLRAMKAEKAATEVATNRAKAAGKPADAAAAAGKAAVAAVRKKIAPTKAGTPARVKEYRVALWRKVAAKVLFSQPEASITVLLSLALAGKGRDLDDDKLLTVFGKVAKATPPGAQADLHNMGKACSALTHEPPEVRQTLLTGLAASAMKKIHEQDLRGVMEFVGVNMAEHWTMCAEYLQLMTKSEIFAVCEELGIRAAMGAAFNKAMGLKRDEFIKAVLSVPNFNYGGLVPADLMYAQGSSADSPIDDEDANATGESTESIDDSSVEQVPELA